MDAAQKQHYVPKFILRQFLSDSKKQQVCVYDKHNEKHFQTSINNIMAECRYNDFDFDDNFIASFEGIACGIEDMVLPVYRSVSETRELSKNLDDVAALTFFLAFQFILTKAHREHWKSLDDALRAKLRGMGQAIEEIEGYLSPTEENLSKMHLLSRKNYVPEFASIYCVKCFHDFTIVRWAFILLGRQSRLSS